jgi:hypothetical protein
MFIRSLLSSSTGEKACSSGHTCPDVLELDSGDFAVIGTDITAESASLPSGSGCGTHERIVRVPRDLLIRIRSQIPERI